MPLEFYPKAWLFNFPPIYFNLNFKENFKTLPSIEFDTKNAYKL